MKFDIMSTATGMLSDLNLWYEKYKPEIFMWGGISGVIGATILACRASRKIDGIVETHKTAMAENKKDREEFEEKKKNVDMTPEDIKTMENKFNQDVAVIYGRTVLNVGKEFVLPAVLGAASVWSIVHSHDILRDRNAELASLAAAGSAAFKEYRSRVVDKYGEEVDKELRHGASKATVVEMTTNPETGEQETQTSTTMTSETENKGHNRDGYDLRYFFDARSKMYDPRNPIMNVRFLKLQERYWNDLIRTRAVSSGTGRGIVFLAEVLRDLFPGDNEIGMQPWEQTMCWVYDEKHPVGDNYIDFGIFYSEDESTKRFLSGMEEVVLMDFNCDGSIYQFV